MNDNYKELKEQLVNFIEKELKHSFKYISPKAEIMNFSPEVFKLVDFIHTECAKVNLKINFDYKIKSKSIFESVDKPARYTYYTKENFYLPFLHYLSIRDNKHISAEDLNGYILDFLELNAEKMSLHDIVIMPSGATRAIANVRFAVDFLRKCWLIQSRNINNRRILEPTMLGILTLIFLRDKNRENFKNIIGLQHESIGKVYNQIFNEPWKLINAPEVLITKLSEIAKLPQNEKDSEQIKKLITEYYNFISNCITLDIKNGTAKLNKAFDKEFTRYVSKENYDSLHQEQILILRMKYSELIYHDNE